MEPAGSDDKYPVRVQCEGCQALLEVRLELQDSQTQPAASSATLSNP